MKVDRCVCYEKTFCELNAYVKKHGADFSELQRVFKCGKGCGLCIPYLRDMLETGQTSFPVRSHASNNPSV